VIGTMPRVERTTSVFSLLIRTLRPLDHGALQAN